MKQVKVYGITEVSVWVVVDVEDNAETDDILDAAYKELGSLTGFCGNGGVDKLCGVYGSNTGLEVGSEIEWAPNGEQDIQEV